MSMTLDELRDWHARRAGWRNDEPEPTGNFWADSARQHMARGAWWKIVGDDFQRSSDHPFPATLDGADASMPKGWEWSRDNGKWRAFHAYPLEVTVDDTCAKAYDLYALSMKAWEQEAAR